MGMDIHSFLEYRDAGQHSPSDSWSLLARFSLARDYRLFDALANARSSQISTSEAAESVAVYMTRGVPTDLSLLAAQEYYDIIVEDGPPDPRFWPMHGVTQASEAESRVRSGQGQTGKVEQSIYVGKTEPRSWRAVSKIDSYCASWLTLAELRETIGRNNLDQSQLNWDFCAFLETFESAVSRLGAGNARFVFWFDR